MKKIKFKQLATFSLCCSLLVNSLTGVTAVAETMTIESSPTKGTVASEATTETEKKTKVEQTEQTKEAKEQQEHKETDATSQDTSEEENQKEGAQPTEATTSSLEASPPRIESRGIPLKTIVYPKARYDFVDETGAPFTTPLSFSGNYQAHAGSQAGTPLALPAPYNKLSAQANGTGSYILSINNSAGFPLTPQIIEKYGAGGTTPNTKYRVEFMLDKLNIATSLKFVDSIKYASTSSNWAIYMYKGYNVTTGIFDNSIEEGRVVESTLQGVRDSTFKINTLGYFEIVQPSSLSIASGGFAEWVAPGYESILLRGFDGTNTIKSKMVYTVTRKQVTEKFVDGAGVAITPPTGFTQNKKTPMTSNNFTYTSAKALPDTYQANGKTYVLKGWYKGKTKPATLKTTKTPSYAVTYDGNDDLNVVYEETEAAEFPEETYQFGFVDEAGKLVNPTDITITYDHKSSAFRGTGGAGSTVSFDTIATNQSATTVGNLKNVTMPATSIARPTETGYNGEVYSNFSIKLPRYYQSLNLYDKTGKINPNYPLPVITSNYDPQDNVVSTEAQAIGLLTVTQRPDQSYTPKETYVVANPSVKYPSFLNRYNFYNANPVGSGWNTAYQTFSGPVYYHLTNRKVTENFVDATGAKLPSVPTGFTQGKQTVIDSDPYTFTQSGTLPKSYKGTNGKTYVLKGWYKGKTKPSTLRTDAPSYKVTYDDNDDLNVVYEETEAAEFPEETYQFGFVDEAGKLVNPADINITYDYKSIAYRIGNGGTATVSYGTIATNQSATTVGNLKNVTLPATSINRPSEPEKGYNSEVYSNFSIKLPKYYQSVNIYDKTGKINPNYPVPVVTRIHSTLDNEVKTEPAVIQALALTQRQDDQSYTPRETQINLDPSVKFPDFLRRYHYSLDVGMFPGNAEYQTFSGPVYYHLTNRKVTENFVDDTGAKLPSAPTGFTQGNQIPMTSDTFKYTAAKALPASYTAGGKTYVFQGWYKGKTKPNTLTTSTTPTYNTTFDDNDDMTAVYKEASISANLTMRGAVDIIDNGATMEYWEVLLKNTGEAPLTSIKIKPTAEWAAGISTPTELFLLGTGQNTKVLPITKEQWEAGFEIPLDSSLPVGGQLTINLIGTKVTGQPNQVLKAAVEVTGNFGNLKASDTVRIKDLDQETKEPTGEGFISVPTFDFGQVGVAGATKQHGLKKAADYYGNGTRNPYLRLKKTQPNWSLTAQLSQPKSAKDSLPTATRLIFGQIPVASVANYNQPTELMTSVGVTKALALTANNSSTSIIGTQEFGGADIYQLDFQFDKVKLEVPANQGTKGEQYNATVTWNLVTGP